MHKLFWCVVLALGTPLLATTRVAFLPFDDNVRLRESWDLATDVPRYFSTSVDTVDSKDSSVAVVAFDTVMKVLDENALSRKEYLSPAWIPRIASRLGVDYLVGGSVNRFKVMKRTVNSDAPLDASTQLGSRTSGSGGIRVMGGLQSYTAEIDLGIDVYDGATGKLFRHEVLSTEQKDGGFKVYLPFQADTDEMNFYYMSRSEFGSVYFRRSVAGVVMKHYSSALAHILRSADVATQSAHEESGSAPREYVSGTILERTGKDVYVDLGIDDNVLQGEILEVLAPDRPLLSSDGDTLGWSEKPIGLIKIRFVKAAHFSQATVIEENGLIEAGRSVRIRLNMDGTGE